MIDFQKVIESDRVILRAVLAEDFEQFKGLTKNPDVWTYFTIDLSIESELKRFVDAAIFDMNNKTRMSFVIIDKATSEIVGSTSLGSMSKRDNRIEIGWTWLSEAAQGTGINGHVKFLLLQYCFEECDLARVELKTDVLNIPARKALEKAGFIEEGILRSHTQMIRNRRRDTIFYGALKEDWEAIKLKHP